MKVVLEERYVADSAERGRVKVVDRRWFTAEGELREPAAGDAAPPSQATPTVPQPVEPTTEAVPPADAAAPEDQLAAPVADDTPGELAGDRSDVALPAGPGIGDIVDLLAQQAMAFMSGQVPGRGRDMVTARFFIDLLGVLKEKTAGRLSLEETNFLDDVLYQLRSLFVSAAR
jgi:hypothetical protein